MSFLRMLTILSVWLFALILGCHSAPLKSPEGGDRETEIKWQKDYLWARANQKNEPQKSCAIFTQLTRDEKFPLREMAHLRQIETCPLEGSAESAATSFDRKKLPAYLQDVAIDILLKQASDHHDSHNEMQLAVEKSKQKLPQNEKIKWMKLAIMRAEELKLEDEQKEYTQRLYSIAPRLDPEPDERKALSVASDLRLARQFDKASEYYEKVLANPEFDFDSKVSALKGIRLTYKNTRSNDKHLEAAQRLIDFLKREFKANARSRTILTSLYEAEVYRARSLWTQGRSSDAQKSFAQLEKRMKGKVSLAELYWLEGRLAEESQDLDKVSRYMAQALQEKFNDGDLRDKILWYSAWNERRRKDLPKAVSILQQLDEKTQTDFTRARAIYWLGRTYSENGQSEEAKKAFERLEGLDPLGYYGLLAHRQLGLPIALKVSPAASSEPSTMELDVPLDKLTSEWLGALQEREALTALLDQSSLVYKRQKSQSDEGWVYLFQQYARAGLYMKLYESLGSLSPERRKNIFEHHPELLFPQPWQEDTHSAAQKFGIQEELIYAIIRQESAFDVHARSLADAFGVMQLLPEVAENLSQKYKIPYAAMEDLFDPKINIQIGAAHLKELLDRHKGQFILAVASYNASENVIHNWMKSRFHGDAQEFIEDIPYEETRAYVRLVMRNLIFYSLLRSPKGQIQFPEWLLKLDAI